MSITSLLNFRQDLTSTLHFRQYKLPNLENRRESQPQNCWVFVDSRQAIASNGGKESLQVTRIRFFIFFISAVRDEGKAADLLLSV